ncbi:MAG: hypothetical protein KME19_13730 [Microcoleus vaginatus WJT46-NPBG5]|nr:hypothetical protein [Microcoleus vaginatus WJT46-NPBG5]
MRIGPANRGRQESSSITKLYERIEFTDNPNLNADSLKPQLHIGTQIYTNVSFCPLPALLKYAIGSGVSRINYRKHNSQPERFSFNLSAQSAGLKFGRQIKTANKATTGVSSRYSEKLNRALLRQGKIQAG